MRKIEKRGRKPINDKLKKRPITVFIPDFVIADLGGSKILKSHFHSLVINQYKSKHDDIPYYVSNDLYLID